MLRSLHRAAFVATLALAASPVSPAEAQTVVEEVVRTTQARSVQYYVRVSEEATFSVYTLRNPLRLFVDLANVEGAETLLLDAAPNAGVLQAHVVPSDDSRTQLLRLVFHISDEAQYDVQSGDGGVHILIESLQGTSADPSSEIASLTAPPERSAAASRATQDAEMAAAERLREEMARLRSELDNSRVTGAEREALQRQLAEVTDQRGSLERSIAERDRRIEDLQQRAAGLEARIAEGAVAEAELQRLRAELADASERAAAAEQRAADEVAAIAELDQARADLARREQEIRALREQLASLESTQASTESREESSSAATDELRRSVEALEAERLALQTASTQLRAEREALAARSESLAHRLDEVTSASTEHAQDIASREEALGLAELAAARRTSQFLGRAAARELRTLAIQSSTRVPAQVGSAAPALPAEVPTGGEPRSAPDSGMDALRAGSRAPADRSGNDTDGTRGPIESPTPPEASAATPEPARPLPVEVLTPPSPVDPPSDEREEARPASRDRCRAISVDPVTRVRTTRMIPCPR
jgi:hypothetical protein